MATLPRRNSGLRGGIGGGAPRGPRNSTGGSGSQGPFGSARDQSANTTPRATGAWGTGGVGGSSSRVTERSSRPTQSGEWYKTACRDRWINVANTIMGQETEIITTGGCTFEGVCHVLLSGECTPGGNRGKTKVCAIPFCCLRPMKGDETQTQRVSLY